MACIESRYTEREAERKRQARAQISALSSLREKEKQLSRPRMTLDMSEIKEEDG